uniref:Multifunctional fusion protein n=1 Tax=Erpetoichthys calabaricus TaxID=27687 RepID=A0A8C4S653_ERPCA
MDAEMSESNITVLMTLPENCSLENYKKPRHLYCWNGGYFLRILPSGVIDGFRERNDKYGKYLQVTAEGFGMVSIKGTESGRFLAMGADGHLDCNRRMCLPGNFRRESLQYLQIHKYQDKNWYVGIKKNGSCKTGPKTHIGQKSIFFLPLSIDN